MIIKIEDAPNVKHITIDISFDDDTPSVVIGKEFKGVPEQPKVETLAPVATDTIKPVDIIERPNTSDAMVNEEF